MLCRTTLLRYDNVKPRAGHSHAHAPAITTITRTLLIGAGLNIVYVVVEFMIGLQLTEVQKTIGSVPGALAVDHVHIWAMSMTENALTAQLTVKADLVRSQVVAIKKEVRPELEHLGIEHTTSK